MNISKKLDLAIVSDEISLDFVEAVRYGKSWGISKYEIRQLKSGRIPQIKLSELNEIERCIHRENIIVTAVSPGIFKLALDAVSEIESHLLELLPRSIEIAKKLQLNVIIIFGFQKTQNESESSFDKVIQYLSRAEEIARNSGITLVIENEPDYWCDTGTNTAKILSEVDSPFLRANWDPANAFGCGEEPFPEGYDAIKKWIANVHVKDTRLGALIECVPIGEGSIKCKEQVQALRKDNIVKHVTIETHCLPLIEKSKRNADVLKRMLEEIHEEHEEGIS